MANESVTLHVPSPYTKLCEVCWAKYFNDCSGFVKAVSEKCGVFLTGSANDIVNHAQSYWDQLASADDASSQAELGRFVIGGLAASEGHGHVVLIVPGLPDDDYPRAYWGQLREMKFDLGGRMLSINGGAGRRFQTINYAWKHHDLPHVGFYAADPIKLIRGF